MSPRYTVLSLVALCVIFLLALKNYETWTRSIEITPEKNPVRKQEAKVENPPAGRPQKVATMGPADAATIAMKNIFSPDRKDFPVQSSETKKIVRPQIVLYGVTIGDNYQFASIVNPGRHLLRGERETLSLKVGDKVGDYKLAKVLPDRIVLEGAEDSFEVLLHDAKTPKKRTEVRTETKPAAVTSTLPTVPAPEGPKTTPPAVATPAPGPTPPAAITRPVPSPTAPAQVPRPVVPSSRRGRMMYYPGAATPAPPGTAPTPAAPAPQPETEEN
ncbi:MAG: hypothetical protein ACXU9K_05545 [Thermodesulfobacteriota bacterium]